MTTPWWDELSNGELEARLLQRGWYDDEAALVARNREAYADVIATALKDDDG